MTLQVLRRAFCPGAVGIVMFGTVALGLGGATGGNLPVVFFVATGIPLAALVRARSANWPLIVLSACIADFAARRLYAGWPATWAAFASAADCLQYLGAAFLFRKKVARHFDILDIKHMIYLSIILASAAILKIVTLILFEFSFQNSPQIITYVNTYDAHPFIWFSCTFLGLFVLSLPILAITSGNTTIPFTFDKYLLIICSALAASTFAIYGPIAFVGVYLILPLLMILGWRYGLIGAGLGALLNNTSGLILTVMSDGITKRLVSAGYGPIAVGAYLELFFVIGMLVSLPLAVARAKQVATDRALAQSASELELHLRDAQRLEERWRSALESAGLGVWEYSRGAQKVFYSRRWREIRGLDDEMPVLWPVDPAQIHPDDLADLSEKLQRHLQVDSVAFEAEYRARRVDGQFRWVKERGSALERDEYGVARRFVGTSLDIHDARQAITLAERRSRLFAAVAAANQAILARGTIVELAEAVCRTMVFEGGIALAFFGVPEADGAQLVPLARACRQDEDRYLDGLQISTRASDATGRGPLGKAFREGRAIWIDDFLGDPTTAPWQEKARRFGWRGSAAIPIMQRSGVTAAISLYTTEEGFFDPETRSLLVNMASQIGIALDALEAEAAAIQYQAELRASEERFRAIYEHSPIGIALQDATTGRFVDANSKLLEIVGWSRKDLLHKAWYEITFAEDVAAEEELLARFSRDALPGFRHEKRVVSFSGEVRWVHMTLATLSRSSESAERYLVMIEDITERQLLQQQLQLAQRMDAIGQLTGGIAHDFNNILAVVMGNSETLADELVDSEQKELANLILHSAERGRELTNRLLAFARMQPLSPRVFDLNQMLAKTNDLIRRSIGANVDISIEMGSDLWNVEADPAMTEAAILNLCLNARDAMPDGGKLVVSTGNVRFGSSALSRHPDAKPGNYVELRIADTGTGIPTKLISRIFEPFFTTKAPEHGTGLGLSQVYGFAKQSGGFIGVSSEMGKGTVFSLCLPASSASLPEAGEAQRSLPCGKETILLVEDEFGVRANAKRQLGKLGYTVVECSDGAAAIDLLRTGAKVDLLFSDIKMPGPVDGLQLAEWASREWPELAVVLATGNPVGLPVEMHELPGSVPVLSKPYSRRALAETLREALDRKMFSPRSGT